MKKKCINIQKGVIYIRGSKNTCDQRSFFYEFFYIHILYILFRMHPVQVSWSYIIIARLGWNEQIPEIKHKNKTKIHDARNSRCTRYVELPPITSNVVQNGANMHRRASVYIWFHVNFSIPEIQFVMMFLWMRGKKCFS